MAQPDWHLGSAAALYGRRRRQLARGEACIVLGGRMRLKELNPQWLASGGEGVTIAATGEPSPRREGVALWFDCPCGCGDQVGVPILNPIDGGPCMERGWQRTGETFDDLTLTPS